MKSIVIKVGKTVGICFIVLYVIFAFSSCAYNWTLEGLNPGWWDAETRGIFVFFFVISLIATIAASLPASLED